MNGEVKEYRCLSRCHSSNWFLVKIDGKFELRCQKCSKSLGIAVKNMNFIGEVIEQFVDDWTFIMPISRTAWGLLGNGDQAYLVCLKTREKCITFPLEVEWLNCEACQS